MIEVILWDIMDTLVRDPFFTHVPSFFGLSFPELLARKHPDSWQRFELGKSSEDELYAGFFRDGTPIDGPGLKRCMHESYRWIDGMEPLLSELASRRVPMHALSNYPPWYRLIDERLGLSRYLTLSFVSCETGIRKPSARAYLHASSALGRPPSTCLFIDDRAVNCEAARAAGMQSVQFQGDVPELRRALSSHGLL